MAGSLGNTPPQRTGGRRLGGPETPWRLLVGPRTGDLTGQPTADEHLNVDAAFVFLRDVCTREGADAAVRPLRI